MIEIKKGDNIEILASLEDNSIDSIDPFAGIGTTGIACIYEGFDCVLIEKEEEYIPILEARIEHYKKKNCQIKMF